MDNQNTPSLLTKTFGPFAAGMAVLAVFLLIVHATPANSQASDMSAPPAVVKTTTTDDAMVFLSTLAGARASLRVDGWISATCLQVFDKNTHAPVALCSKEQDGIARSLLLEWTTQEVIRLRSSVVVYSSVAPTGGQVYAPATWAYKADVGNVAYVCTTDLSIAPQGCIEFFPNGVPMPKNP